MIVEAIFRIKRGLAANWTSSNPVLDPGEPGFEIDTLKIKYGDGATAWNALSYAGAAAYSDEQAQDAVAAMIDGSLTYDDATPLLKLTVPTASGTYTPTLTNVANLDGSTAYVCQYLRVGNTVTVSGRVAVDPTVGATLTRLGITLPIASNFADIGQCAGTAIAPAVARLVAPILADVTNDRAQMEYVTTDTTNQSMYFSFTYRIV